MNALDGDLHDLTVGLATSYTLVGPIVAVTFAAALNAVGMLRIPRAARPVFLSFFALLLVGFGAAYSAGRLKPPSSAASEIAATAESEAAADAHAWNVVRLDEPAATGSIAGGVVYIQVPDMETRFEADAMWKALRLAGFRSPGIELVSGGSPSRPEVRYFNDADRPIADQVAAIAAKQGFSGAVIRTAANYEAPQGQIEFWYPR